MILCHGRISSPECRRFMNSSLYKTRMWWWSRRWISFSRVYRPRMNHTNLKIAAWIPERLIFWNFNKGPPVLKCYMSPARQHANAPADMRSCPAARQRGRAPTDHRAGTAALLVLYSGRQVSSPVRTQVLRITSMPAHRHVSASTHQRVSTQSLEPNIGPVRQSFTRPTRQCANERVL